LVPLAATTHAVLPFDQLLVADAGYDGAANHRFRRQRLGADRLIPAKKRRSAVVLVTTPSRREMLRRLAHGGADPEAHCAYLQRWKAETVMSLAERGWGDALPARLEPTQRVPALLRDVVHNLSRLVVFGSLA
jgi:hypothetical protein